MITLPASVARTSFYKLLDEVVKYHEPIQILGKRHDAVLVSEEDWRAIQETLHLISIPGMKESIRTGLKTPVKRLSRQLDW